MNEELNRLKQLVAARKQDKSRIIAITSGKGGVGKTNVAVNLSIALSSNGNRVVLVDADTNLANADVLFGFQPKATLADVVLGTTKIEKIIMRHPSGVSVIPGNGGTKEFLYMDDHVKERLLQAIWSLESLYDYIILDTAAGLSPMVVDLAVRAHEVLLVTTSEPTAITDAYAMTKILHSMKNDINLKLLFNLSHSATEVHEVYERLSLVLNHFLGLDINLIGYIENDINVQKAVKKQQPFIQLYPKCHASKSISRIAEKIMSNGSC